MCVCACVKGTENLCCAFMHNNQISTENRTNLRNQNRTNLRNQNRIRIQPVEEAQYPVKLLSQLHRVHMYKGCRLGQA
jgi:hypothetical protein